MSPETVLITGASGAIGRALALAYAAPGRTLVLHGRNQARLGETARACEQAGASVETKSLDVRDASALSAWLGELAARRAVDLTIVNAGAINVLRPGVSGETPDDVARVMDVNVRAARATVDAVVPQMRRRRSGQIALMSSLLAWFDMPVAPAYSASKAALKSYGQALRDELAHDGIRVSVVLPGFVKSEMSDQLRIPKPFMLSAADAAARIKRGLERDQALISFPLPLSAGSRLLGALPRPLTLLVLKSLGFTRR